MTDRWKSVIAVGAAASTALLGVVSAGSAQAVPSCTPNVDNSGLSAAVVAHPHQTIAHRTVDATGCDIGIYVGAGAEHVTIDSVQVSGANFQGIFAQKTSHLTIEHSTIRDNAFHTLDASAPVLPGSGLRSYVGQAFAISLFGVSHSTVAGNTVTNNGRGGIGIMDNGPNDPGTITQNRSAALVASSHDRIIDNTMSANYGGCGLVAATQNLGGSLSDLLLAGNTVTGTRTFSASGPDIGGIVVAADLPNSSVTNVRVSRNDITDSFEGGIIVNAEAFNSFTQRISVMNNTVVANNWGHLEAPNTAGVIVFANPAAAVPPGTAAPENKSTLVVHNTITRQFYGIYSVGDFAPKAVNNKIEVTTGGDPIHHE